MRLFLVTVTLPHKAPIGRNEWRGQFDIDHGYIRTARVKHDRLLASDECRRTIVICVCTPQRGGPFKKGDVMKANYNSLWTSLYFSALLLSAGAAAADDFDRCSLANGAGRWGYTVSGQNTTVPIGDRSPDAIVGSGTVDAKGTVTLTLTEVTNGIIQTGKLTGNVKYFNPRDCSATLELDVFEAPPPTTNPPRVAKATWTIVYVENQREIFGILTKLVLPDGSSLPPPVQTLNAKMQFPGRLERF